MGSDESREKLGMTRHQGMKGIIDKLRADTGFMANVAAWHAIPATPASFADLPRDISPEISTALKARGITQLYTHQREAYDAAKRGEDVVVVTPTASGKTLCYNLPILQRIVEDNDARALYIFPTKALASDQMAELHEFIEAAGVEVKTYTYDGDTPPAARRAIRQAGHVTVTNPDMLHSGILPFHTKWVKLFENLRYVVIDEIHAYRGVFGSGLANVMRRLLRLCAFYGSNPQFICCSATIHNPKELAEEICGRSFTMIDQSGAPQGARHLVFYNPPVVNAQLGIRQSALDATRSIAKRLVRDNVQTIVFGRSRLAVEVMLRALKEIVSDPLGRSESVRGYRGGYLPSLRREIERGLRDGTVRAVVSTNALELGIDIGSLDASVICGYPGSIASTWQQAGRAGRRQSESLTILVANSSPIDQYIMMHPEYFLKQSPEMARINPENLSVLISHVKCAAYELPFEEGELFGNVPETGDLLEYLADHQVLRRAGGRFHWQTEEFPASEISLRSGFDENFLINDITESEADPRLIGEMDRWTVPMLLHEHAIYLHEGEQYQVERLDFPNKKAYVRRVNVDYYTDANLNTSLRVLDVFAEQEHALYTASLGEVLVSSLVTMFKKMKMDTGENLGFGEVNLPELDMHTSATWMVLPEHAWGSLTRDEKQGALMGISAVMQRLAPIDLLCAPGDVRVVAHVRDPHSGEPTLYIYDNIPGGVGLAERLYEILPTLLSRAGELIDACPCAVGCPSCVGPQIEVGDRGKAAAKAVLKRLLSGGLPA